MLRRLPQRWTFFVQPRIRFQLIRSSSRCRRHLVSAVGTCSAFSQLKSSPQHTHAYQICVVRILPDSGITFQTVFGGYSWRAHSAPPGSMLAQTYVMNYHLMSRLHPQSQYPQIVSNSQDIAVLWPYQALLIWHTAPDYGLCSPIVRICLVCVGPYLLKDIKRLDSVQRHFTKRLVGMTNLSYNSPLQMGLGSLELGRLHRDLLCAFCT